MLKDEEIRTVMIMFGAYWLTYAYNTSYFGVYMQKLGGDYLLVGIANMLNAVAEIPFHIGPGRRWMKRIGVRNALIVCTVTGIIRWTICAITRDPYILTFTMIMNGIMLVPTVIDVVEYLYAKAPEGYKTSVQTALRTPFMQGGQLLAYFGGGLLVGYLSAHGYNGIRITYAVSALVSVAVLIYVLISGEAAQKKKIQ